MSTNGLEHGVVSNAATVLVRGIVAAPDGNLWFTSQSSIGRSSTAGLAATVVASPVTDPRGITVGADGNLWLASQKQITRITPVAGATARFTGPAITSPYAITKGPDGNVWFTNLG